MGLGGERGSARGRWMGWAAALLGWMFDGAEMGLFPQVARPSLIDLLGTTDDKQIGLWIGVATARFLVGAAPGGGVVGGGSCSRERCPPCLPFSSVFSCRSRNAGSTSRTRGKRRTGRRATC